MTDTDEDVLELMQQNVALNNLSGRVDCRQLDWSDRTTWLGQGQDERVSAATTAHFTFNGHFLRGRLCVLSGFRPCAGG